MKRSISRIIGAGLLAVVANTGLQRTAEGQATLTPTPQAKADSIRHPYTAADINFMTGMIGHHAQAVLIAGWAPTHGASQPLRTMCERIVVGQNDEIGLMQRWLRDRGEPVPSPDTSSHMMPGMDHAAMNHAAMDSTMNHSGMDHSMLMPGMLTPEQLAQLDKARGPEFDRLFLTFMIRHHQGALTMVNQLFASEGAGQDETTFRLASDIYADQSTEIDRMQKMLVTLPS